MDKRRIKARSPYHSYREKIISIKYHERVFVALVIQPEISMRDFIVSSVACPAVPYISTLSYKRHNIRKKVTEYKMCVLILSRNFVWTFLILGIVQRQTITNVRRSSCKVAVSLVRF